MESKFLQRTLVSQISNILNIQAGEHGDGQQLQATFASGLSRRRDDFGIAVNRQETHAGVNHNLHCALDGFTNVENLEIKKYLLVARLEFTHKFESGPGE